MDNETKDERYHKIREKIESMTLMDDRYMSVYFKDFNEGMELVLRIIMQKPDLKVLSVTTQEVMQNLRGRSVKVDVLAEDADGKLYNIEVQKDTSKASEKRARYHSSILDCNVLLQGDDFEDLPESYVIFITTDDYIGDGAPVHTIKRYDEKTKKLFNDGMTIIYVNGECRNEESEIGKLMSDFFNANPEEMNYNILSERAKYFKYERVTEMRDVFEEEREEGRAEGREEERQEMIKKYIQKSESEGKTPEMIISELQKYFDYPADEAKDLFEKYSALQMA